jgi:hypothetical protein
MVPGVGDDPAAEVIPLVRQALAKVLLQVGGATPAAVG